MGTRSRIALIGFMGSGKSTVGKQLAGAIGFNFVDLDEEIEKQEKCSISEIFGTRGEEYFRELEERALRKVSSKNGLVVSCGGGIIERPANRELLKSKFFVVFLDVDFDTAWNRISNDISRPKASLGREESEKLFMKRRKLYEATADVRINVSGKSPAEIVNCVVKEWRIRA